jgi:ribulose-5-phosphate 4-epimerase/fuculose-1-phosphate aldolase
MNEHDARAEMCRIGRSLFDRGYVHGTSGNISFRLGDGSGYLITPTDACLGFLEPSALARLDEHGVQVSGGRASKTSALHLRILAEARAFDPETACVIHTHSAHCVALTLKPCGEELLAPLTPYFVMKVGHVPVVPYERPGAPQAVEAVAAAIVRYGRRGTALRGVMLERLGPVVWHDAPAVAMAVLEELEETARLVILAGAGIESLSEARIQELRRAFNARW